MRHQERKLIYKVIAGIFLCFSNYHGSAQEHMDRKPEHKWLRLAEEQYHQGHYAASLKSARRFLTIPGRRLVSAASGELEKARYFQSLAQLQLNVPGAEDTATRFLATTANTAFRQRVSLALAQYYFRHEKLSQAIPYYENANISNLTNAEIADSKFELAYAYFNSRDFARAEPLFASIKEVQGKYYLAGNYYYGLLAYNNNKYEEALNSFRRIQDEPQYRNIVPYYIAELYYFMGDRKKALEEAIKLTRRKDKLYYDNELHLLAAQVLFEEQRYGEALPYFEHYYEHTDKIRKEELYEMGYSYYRVNEWKNAIEKFKPLSNAQDSLGQTAMYLLGDCYLKVGDKKSARNAFGICADMPFNSGQQEASLLLYGKLSYDMGFNDDAIRSFKALIDGVPRSVHNSEAKTFLSDLLVKTNRYEDAYNAIKGASVKNREYWQVWQKVTYGYAMQRLRNGDDGTAKSLLESSLQNPVDEAYEAAAYFWLGDIAFRQNRPQETIERLGVFVNKAPGNRKLTTLSPNATLPHAYLNLGYAAMKLDRYAEAQGYFAKARQGSADMQPAVIANALAREADAAFMQKNYKEALSLYDKAIAANTSESGYATLQKAILLGVQGKLNEKISLLQQLIKTDTKFAHDARYELANTYIEEDKYQLAITQLEPLTTQSDARHYAARAWMKTGFAYQELGNNKKAIEVYKKVVTDFPTGEDRPAALEALKRLYVEVGEPETYARLLTENNLPGAGMESMDSTYYASAEAQIASGKWAAAKTALTTYLEKFPNGLFTTHAHYYKGESHFQLKENEAALKEFDIVLSRPWSEFSEATAQRAASITFTAGDFLNAANYYAILRNNALSEENVQAAYSGMMQSYYRANKFEEAARYADTLLALPKLSETVFNEVQLFKARSLQQGNKPEEALIAYKQLEIAPQEAIAAEARYRIAEIYFQQDKLKEAEEIAAEALRLNTGNEYWTVKSYLLIADILIKQKDYFNAKATLQSLVKNTKNAELKKQASQKLEEVKRLEKQQTKLKDN